MFNQTVVLWNGILFGITCVFWNVACRCLKSLDMLRIAETWSVGSLERLHCNQQIPTTQHTIRHRICYWKRWFDTQPTNIWHNHAIEQVLLYPNIRHVLFE
ncbi:hypothetical protein RTP6_005332 [Batrachochytrium dendrobatidis]